MLIDYTQASVARLPLTGYWGLICEWWCSGVLLTHVYFIIFYNFTKSAKSVIKRSNRYRYGVLWCIEIYILGVLLVVFCRDWLLLRSFVLLQCFWAFCWSCSLDLSLSFFSPWGILDWIRDALLIEFESLRWVELSPTYLI